MIIAMMRELRGQLEIRLQKRNSELQAYNKPKETFPEKKQPNKKTPKQTILEAAVLEMNWVAVTCCYCWLNYDSRLNTGERHMQGPYVILQQDNLTATHWSKRDTKTVLRAIYGRMRLKSLPFSVMFLQERH